MAIMIDGVELSVQTRRVARRLCGVVHSNLIVDGCGYGIVSVSVVGLSLGGGRQGVCFKLEQRELVVAFTSCN